MEKNKPDEKYSTKSINSLYISAVKRNSGKTTISIALTRLLKDKGYAVQPFKKGPDFIDPMWLTKAAGRGCHNLDFYFISKRKIKKHFINCSLNSDISIIEGNHGLHDSFDVFGKNSNADMAKLLGVPVILIVDVGELNRGVVPLLMGFKNFDKDVDIKGVILNKIHSARHEKNLLRAINHYTDFKVVGRIPNEAGLSIKQRHLGLMSTLGEDDIESHISTISSKISGYVDIESIVKISGIRRRRANAAGSAGLSRFRLEAAGGLTGTRKGKRREKKKTVRVGLAYDNAFNFYYNENIEALESYGCEIVRFSPLYDKKLPDVDALYIGGGFPEILCKELEANVTFRKDLIEKIENGLPVYAECGGLMYMCKSISFNDEDCKMVGAIDARVRLTKKPKGHGYTRLSPAVRDKNGPLWFNKISSIRGHEFHHSYVETPAPDNLNLSFNVIKGYGVNGFKDGITYKNLYAAYTHIYSPSSPGWFKNWVSFIKTTKIKQGINFFLDKEK